MGKLENNIKKDSKINKFDILKLSVKNLQLVPLEITENENDYTFTYITDRLFEAENMGDSCDKLELLRFLINVANLKDLCADYYFSLDPKNLYYDFNMMPKVLERNLLDREVDFLNQYKALIACVLDKNYTYENYLNGGKSLMSKNKFLSKIIDTNSVEEVVEILKKEYIRLQKKEKNNFFKIGKKTVIISSIIVVVIFGLSLYSFYSIYNNNNKMEYNETILKASMDFNKKEYSSVIKDLKQFDSKELSKDMQYILATSFIETSSLNDIQKHNALSQVRVDSNDEYNLFWVYLGREEFKKAYDLASQFDDDRLLYYAYSVEYASLPTNTKMSASEKASRKEELKKLLDEYVVKMKGKK